MKKLLAFVFVFATVVVATNVLSSCKDYDEDNYDDLQLQLARNDKSLRDLIGDNYEELCSLYNEVKEAQETCARNCSIKHAQLDTAIGELTEAVAGKADTATVNAIQREITVINNQITTLETNYNLLDSTVNVIQNSITNIFNHINRLSEQVSTDSTNIQDLLGRVQVNEGNIDELFQTVHAMDSVIGVIQSDITIINNRFDNYYTKQEVDSLDSILNAKVDTLQAHVENRFVIIESTLNDVASKAQDAYNRAFNDSIWIETLKQNLQETADALNGRIDSLLGIIDSLKQLPHGGTSGDTYVYGDTIINNYYGDTITFDSLNYVLKSVYDAYVDSTDQKIAGLQAADKRLEGLIKTADSLRYVGDDLLQKQINAIVLALGGKANVDDLSDIPVLDLSGIRDSLANIWDIKLPALEDAFKTADQALQDQIDDINDEIDDINGRLDDIEDAIDALKDRVSDLEKKMEQITGIIPQATVNPVFGSFAAPLGINSKVLVTFYGEFKDAVEFPTKESGSYVKYSQKFTDQDWAAISSAATMYRAGIIYVADPDDSQKANAGTLYVTVNPSEVNFEGAQLTLVNSKDDPSKVQLSPLEKENDYIINFGYTRAATDNGLYRAKATLSKADIDAVKVDIEPGLKSAVTEAVKQHSMPSLANLGMKLYDQFNGILPAQALKAQWTTTLTDGSTYTRTFRSDYGLAAAAVKPLSYGVLDELHVVTVPGYEQVCDLVDRLVSKVEKELKKQADKYIDKAKVKINGLVPDMKKLAVAKIDNMAGEVTYDVIFATTFSDSEGNTYRFANDATTTGTVLKLYDATTGEALYSLEGTGFTLEADGVHVAVTDKLLYNYLASSIMEVNQLVSAIQDAVDGVNDLIASVDSKSDSMIEKASDKVSSKIYSYIDKINNKLAKLINTSGARIQPVLFVSTNAGTKVASGLKAKPTVITTAQANLILTSYTGEILTPAYKKHVAAVDVIKDGVSAQGGDADCQAALAAFNQQGGDINTVFDGTTVNVPATFKRGYTYVIAYSGLDYHGKISMHKYYIKF
ncbi:MAG: hypothetical protein II750_01330 [Bacteroidaceae bacterium]|nr:hypothetical protein [Bacteroidaceae bacterium]